MIKTHLIVFMAFITIFCVILSGECLASEITAAIDQQLLDLIDLIDEYAPAYFNANWNMNISQYKVWIATIAWSEGGYGGYGAHSGWVNPSDPYHSDVFNHVEKGSLFKFSTGIGPFQLDNGSTEHWELRITKDKLDSEKALLSVLNWHKQNRWNSGLTLANFAAEPPPGSDPWPWCGLDTPGKRAQWWSQVTGEDNWLTHAYSNVPINWTAIRTVLAQRASDLSYEYSYNVESLGYMRWNIKATDNVETETGRSVVFDGLYPTWRIRSRTWGGGENCNPYYYTYRNDLGPYPIEVWVHDNTGDVDQFKYIFLRECNGQYPEHRILGTNIAGEPILSSPAIILGGPDTTPPTISCFTVPTSVAVGDSFPISYTVSDIGGSHLHHLEVWRYWGAQPPSQWSSDCHIYPDISLTGDTNTGSFSDSTYAPLYVGTWWYGIHVVDNSGNWNDEQNSQTSGVPDLGPIQVTVVAAQPPSMPSNPNPSDGSTIPDQPLVLSWSATSHTSSYDVYINGTFKQNVTTNQWIQNMSFTPGVSQSWNIVAKGAGGSTVGPNWYFTVQQVGPPPIINCISPISGPTSGGTTVTITGTNFDIYHPFTVYFGTTWATAIGASDSEIVVSTRAHAAGTVDVTVVTIGGSSAISQVDQFTYGGVSLPNLTPYQPSGWSDKIVVTNQAEAGSPIDSNPLYTTDNLYVNFAVINNGAASTGTTFYARLYVDGSIINTYSSPIPLTTGIYWTQSTCSIGRLSAGMHTVKIEADSSNIINEISDTDNSYTKTITVTASPDTQGPMLTIISPNNNSTVTSASLTISGMASDNGYGNNGISSVTVNAISADGGMASGPNIANWSVTIELSTGVNLIMVVAKDIFNNLSQQQISVTYLPLNSMIVDLNHDGIPNFSDFSIFATFWQNSTCSPPNWCEETDFYHSGSVDILDLATFADYWLEGI
jgi:hypothetical protein